jgi:2-succinyl-6-hydroxy-2,4-cyclohexadiene-1-carboxylate synthase
MSAPLPLSAWGPPGGPPLVLLHGFMGRGEDWAPLAPLLADPWRVVALDLPGHGTATGLPPEAYTLEGAARTVVDTLDELGARRAPVVGYSMGGRIAGHVALVAPERVEALVLESAHPGFASTEQRTARLARDHDRARRLRADFRAFLDEWTADPLFGLAQGDSGRRALVEDRLRGDPEELARALVGLGPGNQEPVGERLRALGVPTLLVAGSRDVRYARLLGEMAADCGFALHVEAGAAHTVHRDRPDAFARAVRTFLERTIPTQHVHD